MVIKVSTPIKGIDCCAKFLAKALDIPWDIQRKVRVSNFECLEQTLKGCEKG
jgi:hypothetical protein